jgi:hypothetical protein
MGETGPYTACAVLARYGYGEGLEAPVMALHSPINDKPPSGGNGGLTWPVGGLTLELQLKRDGSVTGCFSPVNYPTTLGLSGRGNHAQIWLKSRPGRWASRRAACRWEARTTTGKPVKSCQQRMAPSVINSARLWVRRNSLPKPCGFTISHQGV